MTEILSSVNTPDDLKALPIADLEILAENSAKQLSTSVPLTVDIWLPALESWS